MASFKSEDKLSNSVHNYRKYQCLLLVFIYIIKFSLNFDNFYTFLDDEDLQTMSPIAKLAERNKADYSKEFSSKERLAFNNIDFETERDTRPTYKSITGPVEEDDTYKEALAIVEKYKKLDSEIQSQPENVSYTYSFRNLVLVAYP